MLIFLHLALTVAFPIALLIGIGWWIDRAFKLDVPTLVRLNFWVFIPALTLVKLIQSPVSSDLSPIFWFTAIQIIVLGLAGWMAGYLPGMRKQRSLLVLGTFAYNIGNYGIPLATFAFGEKWIGPVIAMLVVQNVASFTLGPLLLGGGTDWRKTLLGVCKVPAVLAVVLAMAVRFSGIGIPGPVMSAMGSLSDGLVPVALLTLGVQMSRTPMMGGGVTMAVLLALRLVIAPGLTWVLAKVMGLTQDMCTLVTICAALPMAVTVFLLCSEYGAATEDAARAVVWTTILATLLLPLLIALLPAIPR